MNNNSTPDSFEETDFFAAMYTDTNWNIIIIITLIIGALIGLISTLGIIWYEKNGNHRCRTVINQMFSTLAWIVFLYIVLVYLPDGVRFLIGPLHISSCEVIYFLKNFFIGCFLLTLDCIILLRYVFFFKWDKFAVINDDLIARFFNFSIAILGIWLVVVQRLSFGKMPLIYFMCAGKNPKEDAIPKNTLLSKTEKINLVEVLVYVSFSLHIIVLTKIYLYERRIEKRRENIQLGTLTNSNPNNGDRKKIAWSSPSNNTSKTPNLTKSMIDFTTQISCLLFLVVVASVNITAKKMMEPNKVDQSKYRWYAYFHQIDTTVGLILISLIYFMKNSLVFYEIWKRIKSQFQQ